MMMGYDVVEETESDSEVTSMTETSVGASVSEFMGKGLSGSCSSCVVATSLEEDCREKRGLTKALLMGGR